jgi:hypothetical protein
LRYLGSLEDETGRIAVMLDGRPAGPFVTDERRQTMNKFDVRIDWRRKHAKPYKARVKVPTTCAAFPKARERRSARRYAPCRRIFVRARPRSRCRAAGGSS